MKHFEPFRASELKSVLSPDRENWYWNRSRLVLSPVLVWWMALDVHKLVGLKTFWHTSPGLKFVRFNGVRRLGKFLVVRKRRTGRIGILRISYVLLHRGALWFGLDRLSFSWITTFFPGNAFWERFSWVLGSLTSLQGNRVILILWTGYNLYQ